MATTAPKIALRDGSGFTTNLVFTTNADTVIVTGEVEVTNASLQVSVNGGAWTPEPEYVRLVQQSFTLPDLSVYPRGLPIEYGVNTILLRVVDIVGGVSTPSTVFVTRIASDGTDGIEVPSGLRVRRDRTTIDILVAKPRPLQDIVLDSAGEPVLVTTTTSTFRGYNFYASTEPAGTSGYYRINDKPLTAPVEYEEDENRTYDEVALWDVSGAKFIRVRISEEDEFGRETAVRLNAYHRNTVLSGKVRFTGLLENYDLAEYVVFTHDRSAGLNSDQFAGVASTDPLYYVATGVYFDPVLNTEIESAYSQEVLGGPLVIDTTIRDLPGRTQDQIVYDYLDQVTRTNDEISLIPGSTTRDVMDPFTSEAERIWFLLDYVHRSGSFLTLLAVDDINGTGQSDDVAASAYKQALKAALGLQSNSAVQSLIDQQFDKLASNVGKTRLTGRQAVGTLTLYTKTRPTMDLTVPAGSFATSTADSTTGVTSQRFRIGGSFTLPAATADAYYNFNERRYELRVQIVAESAGSAGNVPAGTIKTLVGIGGLLAVNESATVFGDDQESNADLAARSMLGFSAVDTGTESGYANTAASKIGVLQRKIIKSGDPLMMRDYDDIRKKHSGGKVDVWIRGVRERQVTDTFAFTYDVASSIRCKVVDAEALIFTVLDSRVTLSTPLVALLSLRNASTGADYDVTGVTFLDYQKFKLRTDAVQPDTTLDDIVIGSYRFQVLNRLYMTLQPVRHVVSVVGEVSGTLTPDVHYKLYKTDDPLLEGESTIAKNYVAITPSGGIPQAQTVSVDNESHVLIGFEPEPLHSIGINTATIRMTNEAGTIEYFPGPHLPEAPHPDFEIITGTPTAPAKIVRTVGSRIANGQEVLVRYVHDENFTVTYVVNDLLQQLQSVIDTKRHITADVLVKQAIDNEIDIETTVQLARGGTKDKADPLVRSNVSLDLAKKGVGEGVAQSNIDAAINDTEGVDFNVLPMARLAYGDGSQRLRETVLSSAVRIPALDGVGGKTTFILTNSLVYPTTDGGGLDIEHKGVFQDDVLLSPAPDILSVSLGGYQAFIIGAAGATIEGYSDEATLEAEGYLSNELERERLQRTANHILVSLTGSDTPASHEYTASYVVRGDSGAHDIEVTDIEVVGLGDFTITWKDA